MVFTIFSNNMSAGNEPNKLVLSYNSSGVLLEATTWTSGDINQFYLDFAHTQHNFDDIRLDVGSYSWKLETIKKNNKHGKVNLDIYVKFQNGSNDKKVDRQFSPGRTDNGSLVVEDYKSQSGGQPVGFGMVKVHIGRADANTNVNYKITLTKTGNHTSHTPGYGYGGSGFSNNNNNDCNYSDLGSKTGNVIGNTVGKYSSDKKACKNAATVRVTKTGGSARTTILVYKSSTANGTGSLIKSDEFPNGNNNGTKTLNLTGINNKFIRVELKNRSATNQFK